MILGFTGTRAGMTGRQKLALHHFIIDNNVSELHHGACRGADSDAQRVYLEAVNRPTICMYPGPDGGFYDCLRVYLPTDKMLSGWFLETWIDEPAPYLQRNGKIVELVDHIVAAPKTMTEQFQGSGTWATIRRAKKAGKPVTILEP